MKRILQLTAIEVIVSAIYIRNFNSYYGLVINLLYLGQLLYIVFTIGSKFKEQMRGIDKVIISTIMIFTILFIAVFDSEAITYILTGKVSNLSNFGSAGWEYYNLYDEGYNVEITSSQHYNLKSNEYISDEIISELNLENEIISMNGGYISSERTIVLNDEKETDLYYNDGLYMYSIRWEEDATPGYMESKLYFDKYEGTKLIKTVDLGIRCRTETVFNSTSSLEYYDKDTEDFYISCHTRDNRFIIVKVDKNLDVEKFFEINIYEEYDIIYNISLTKFEKVDNFYRVILISRDLKRESYIIDIDKTGKVLNKFDYNNDLMYKSSPLNISYNDNRVYLISYVHTKEGNGDVGSKGELKYPTYRIEEFDINFNLKNVIYIRGDNLGNFDNIFYVVKSDNIYTLYSNTDKIELTTHKKELLKAINILALSFSTLFYIQLVFILWAQKSDSMYGKSSNKKSD